MRVWCALAIALAIGHVALAYARLPGWACPLHSLTGIPCPGCGLTRSVVALLHGRLAEALRYHAFGFLAPVPVLLAILLVVLPRPWREKLAASLRTMHHHTWPAYGLLALLVGYWIIRLAGIVAMPPDLG